ncbi:MAG: hypothetical protein RI885_2155 [Actinomycetota bacterium]|jgi:hypothetical protein
MGVPAAPSDAVVGTGLALATVGIVFALLLVIGFAVLLRRGRAARRAPGRALDDLGVRADIALVRLDDLATESADEVAFAQAQFGDARVVELTAALTAARSTLASAFALKQRLDDAVPDSVAQVREWNARILMLCETATERLVAERAVFDGLRSLERGAPDQIGVVRRELTDAAARVDPADDVVRSLAAGFAASAVESVLTAPAEARRLLDSARASLDDADTALAAERFASADIGAAAKNVRSAHRLLDELEHRAVALSASSARLDESVRVTGETLLTARAVRDSPPDPTTGAAIGDAIAYVERALAAARPEGSLIDPDAARSRIEAAADALDTALAGARSQEQRLTHAAKALVGALVTARSQIETTRAYIAGGHGSAGAEARTRLAEAVRLLEIAEVESDPVIALDTARSSATYSRDADALARYNQMH